MKVHFFVFYLRKQGLFLKSLLPKCLAKNSLQILKFSTNLEVVAGWTWRDPVEWPRNRFCQGDTLCFFFGQREETRTSTPTTQLTSHSTCITAFIYLLSTHFSLLQTIRICSVWWNIQSVETGKDFVRNGFHWRWHDARMAETNFIGKVLVDRSLLITREENPFSTMILVWTESLSSFRSLSDISSVWNKHWWDRYSAEKDGQTHLKKEDFSIDKA